MTISTKPLSSAGSLERPKQREMEMRFVTWSLRGLYVPGSLKTDAKVISEFRKRSVGQMVTNTH